MKLELIKKFDTKSPVLSAISIEEKKAVFLTYNNEKLYQLLIANPIHILKYFFRGKFKFAKAIIKGALDFIIIKNKTL